MQRQGGGGCPCAASASVIPGLMGGGRRRGTRKVRRQGGGAAGLIYSNGGGCGCGLRSGGGKYKPTRKNRAAYRRWKKGESVGFTMRSHLKAIGFIPRTSRKHYGKKVVSNKYK